MFVLISCFFNIFLFYICSFIIKRYNRLNRDFIFHFSVFNCFLTTLAMHLISIDKTQGIAKIICVTMLFTLFFILYFFQSQKRKQQQKLESERTITEK